MFFRCWFSYVLLLAATRQHLLTSLTAIKALYSNTTGQQLAGGGSKAMWSNTTGASNTAWGYQASYTNATSNFNVAVGTEAMYNNVAAGDTGG
jgi:hypothetical protein